MLSGYDSSRIEEISEVFVLGADVFISVRVYSSANPQMFTRVFSSVVLWLLLLLSSDLPELFQAMKFS